MNQEYFVILAILIGVSLAILGVKTGFLLDGRLGRF
jgi:hypothetical protein